jgi:quinol-cytochrome oxidoreductase complex cytochrome b subunit
VQAKDGLNAMGLGWVNLTNAGQMFGMHVVVMPLVLTVIIGAHITLVRLKSVVPPYPDTADRRAAERSPS